MTILNAEQVAATNHIAGPLRLVAGAGTGKTQTLTERIVGIVRAGHALPGEILALTFTNKAAAEMRERINRAIQGLANGQQQVRIDTYNAFGATLVTEHAELLGYPPIARTLTAAQAWVRLRESTDAIEWTSVDLFNVTNTWSNPLSDILNLRSRMNDELVTDAHLREYIDRLPDGTADERQARNRLDDYARAILVYRQALHERGEIDFGDQVALAVQLLERPEIAALYADRYAYIVVDEFQDTNYAQSQMVRLLAESRRNICVVGDPNQAIYAFRGAAPENIERFAARDFPDAATLTLSQNYRSTQQILDVGNAIWHDTPGPFSGNLVSAPGKQGRRPVEAVLMNREAEASYIAEEIERLRRDDGFAYREMAILVRKNEMKLDVWRRLRRLGIPVAVSGSDLFRTPEVREVLAYLRAIHDPTDSASAAHALFSCVWGYDEASVLPLMRMTRRDTPLLAALQSQAHEEPGGAAARFVTAFDHLVRMHARVSLPRLVEEVIRLRATCFTQREEANARRFRRFVAAFVHAQPAYVGLPDLLAYIDMMLVGGSDEEEAPDSTESDAVAVMTAHGAKGLEWKVVFVATANDADFITASTADSLPDALAHAPPGRPELDDFPSGAKYEKAFKEWRKGQNEQENRRVFYVALTRAQERLYVTRTRYPTHFNKERKQLRFFTAASALCDQYESDIEATPAIVLRAFTDDHPDVFDVATDGDGALMDAWTDFAGRHGLPNAAETVGDAIAQWRRQVAEVERQRAFLQTAVTDEMQPVPVVHKGRLVLSYSHLVAYQQCPRQYYLRYVRDLPALPEPWRTRAGSAFHAAVARYTRARREGQADDFSLDMLERWYREGLGSDGAAIAQGASTVPLAKYWEGPDRWARPFLVEEEFYLPIGNGVIHGFIDCVQERENGEIELVDYKTNAVAKSEVEVRADLQLPLYLLACRELLKVTPAIASMVFVRHGTRVSLRYSDEELEEVKMRVGALVDEIAAPDPDAVNPAHCAACGYRFACTFSPLRGTKVTVR